MIWAIVITVVGLPVIVLIAWAMWLTFATLMARWYGIEGLKNVHKVAAGFRPLEWASLGRGPQGTATTGAVSAPPAPRANRRHT